MADGQYFKRNAASMGGRAASEPKDSRSSRNNCRRVVCAGKTHIDRNTNIAVANAIAHEADTRRD
jgi:hypothetical protein